MLDGAIGEGGGQILRSALALSVCLGRPFQLINIRRNRPRPGLQAQHLVAVRAAAAVSDATVVGAQRGSQALSFTPGAVRPGRHHFHIGTAGSTTLVLQAVLPALMLARGPSHILIDGGTHNPLAPSFDFLALAYVPLLVRMGADVVATLDRPGFHPAGGGRVHVEVTPVERLEPLQLDDRGELLDTRAVAMLAHLPSDIGERELRVLERRLDIAPENLALVRADEAQGPGNCVSVMVHSRHVTEVFTAFGQRGVPAEKVAGRAAEEARRYLESDAAVGEHLADQLLVPLALAGGGSYTTLRPSPHVLTNLDVVRRFIDLAAQTEQLGPDAWRIALG